MKFEADSLPNIQVYYEENVQSANWMHFLSEGYVENDICNGCVKLLQAHTTSSQHVTQKANSRANAL